MPSPDLTQALLQGVKMPPGRAFVHELEGDGLMDLGLFRRDRLLLEFRPPKDGDLVVALVAGQHEVYRYRYQGGKPSLVRGKQVLAAGEIMIQGVVTVLVRPFL